MPSAAASRRGAALNWRLAVNGIQKASSRGRVAERMVWSMGGSPERTARIGRPAQGTLSPIAATSPFLVAANPLQEWGRG